MIPMFKLSPPRLSEAGALLRNMEDSGIFGNFGPINTRFEKDLVDQMFGGIGSCLTVCNATLGLMLAIRQATEHRPPKQRYALMPSFTFAAAAQAALWCGLTPLLCDIDPDTWAADPGAEAELLQQYAGEIAVVVPYATFGYDIDLGHYERLEKTHGIPVVVDAAASLGTTSRHRNGFAAGFRGTAVFSMHATKSFATGEGGVVYSADDDLIRRLRVMCNFGFGKPRMATMPGLNAKLSEVGALLAQLRLESYQGIIQHRASLVDLYRQHLPGLTFQASLPFQQAHQFCPVLLPPEMAPMRAGLQATLKENGIAVLTYFSPHLAEQDYFKETCVVGDLSVTDDIGSRIISLPLYDTMVADEVIEVASGLKAVLEQFGVTPGKRLRPRRPSHAEMGVRAGNAHSGADPAHVLVSV